MAQSIKTEHGTCEQSIIFIASIGLESIFIDSIAHLSFEQINHFIFVLIISIAEINIKLISYE